MEKKSNSKLIFIILAIIIVVVGAFSLIRSFKPNEVEYSTFRALITSDNVTATFNDEFDTTVYDVSVSEVEFDDYKITFVVKYKLKEGAENFTTAKYNCFYSRTAQIVSEIETALSDKEVKFTYTDPNAGAFWSNILPFIMLGLGLLVVFFIMRASGGGTKGAMNFAKTNARLNQNVKTRFSRRLCIYPWKYDSYLTFFQYNRKKRQSKFSLRVDFYPSKNREAHFCR